MSYIAFSPAYQLSKTDWAAVNPVFNQLIESNLGPDQTGRYNIGYNQKGLWNIGVGNTGKYNTGFGNVGIGNTGVWNGKADPCPHHVTTGSVGVLNTGSGSLGAFNSGSNSIGFGNTKDNYLGAYDGDYSLNNIVKTNTAYANALYEKMGINFKL